MPVIGFALAVLVGLALGLLGGGGSILVVPIFVYLLHFPAKEAIAMSLPVVGVVALVGAFVNWRAGQVRFGAALPFGAAAMAGAFAGARLSHYLAGSVQMALLGAAMLAAALAMFRGAPSRASAEPPPHRLGLLFALGAGVGALTGAVGIGGGFLIVPALVLLAGLPMKTAVGTSLLVIAMNAAAGTLGHVGSLRVPWLFLAGFTSVALLGLLAGSRLSRRLSGPALRRSFAVFLVLMGGFILYTNTLVHPAVAAVGAR